MGTGLSALALIYFPEYALEFATGCFIGLLVTPDLDIDATTYTEELLRMIPPIGFLFRVCTFPYAILFVHRGWSHHFIVGTLSRVIWLFIISLVIAAFVSGVAAWFGKYNEAAFFTAKSVILYMLHPALLAGMLIQDLNHYALDGLFSEK
jgi:uncharacterized metal-binding protein